MALLVDINQNSNGGLKDHSGTVTTASTSQEVMPANNARKYLLFQNLSAGDMYINFTASASASTIRVGAGNSFVMDSFVTSEPLNVFCVTASTAFTAKQGQ